MAGNGFETGSGADSGRGGMLAAGGALVAVWVAGAWLVAGAAREAASPALTPLFHLGAALAAVALFALSRSGRDRRPNEPGSGGLASALGSLGAGDLVEADRLARTLPDLGPAIGRAAAGVAGRVERLQSSSLAVAGAAEGVERTAGTLAAGAAQQAAAAGEVTAAMEELARTAAEIAEHAERQSRLVERARAAGGAGGEAVAEAVAGIGAVERRIADVTARADTLGSRSREIFRVLELIADIAQETHLLSLNAALEAAAAGDRGRRFAIVAGEVRVLAERVRDSVTNVRSQVEEFASAIRSTVVATEEGGKEAARVTEEARSATAALEHLRAALEESSHASRQISSVTRQQTAATEEVVSTLRELHQVVERMSRDLEALSSTATRLREVGLDLQLSAQAFRIESPRSLQRRIDGWRDRIVAAGAGGVDAALAALVEETGFVEAGYLAGADGRLVAIRFARAVAELPGAAAAVEELGRLDLRGRPWFRAAIDAGRAAVTPPHRSLLSDEPCLTVALPVADAAGGTGVLAFDVNVRHWTEIGE
ncbi:MAG: hypothetical protein AMXMBFR36_29910 [Acidobacteriota bacterium]